jgi:hypothetical protein
VINADRASTSDLMSGNQITTIVAAIVQREGHGEREHVRHVLYMKGDRLMGIDLAEALLDIATTLMSYGISKKDSDKIADDFQIIIESFKGLETAFFGKGE